MKRFIVILLLAAGCFAQEQSQQHAAEAAQHGSGGAHKELGIEWKWANFLILAAALGWIISKQAGPYFQSRTSEIQAGLREAAKLREDAEKRVADIERRVANLDGEMNSLRDNARVEMMAEAERMKAETARTIEKIRAHAAIEIASATKMAKQELKAYSADLAVQLAAAQIQQRLTPAAQMRLVDNFAEQLGK